MLAITLIGSATYGGQTAQKKEGKKDAQAFVEAVPSLVGKSRDDVITAIGPPDSTVNSGTMECWKYRKLFGEYRRRKVIFGHISLTWEVRLELVLKDGAVLSAKPSGIQEVHRQRGDVTEREMKSAPNQPPLRMPISGTPAADAPVAPPPGIAGR
jgi:hypothetical protein